MTDNDELTNLRLAIAKARGWKVVCGEHGWDVIKPNGNYDGGNTMMRSEELAEGEKP
jgi:hypothetical protein